MKDNRKVARSPSPELVEKWMREYDAILSEAYTKAREKYGKRRIDCESCGKGSALRNLTFVAVSYIVYSDPQHGPAHSHNEYTCPKCGHVNKLTGGRKHIIKAQRLFGKWSHR